MREQLNNNPAAQLGVIVVLLIVGVFLFMSMSGGGEEGAEAESPAGEVAATSPATESTLGAASEELEAGVAAPAAVEAVPPPTLQPPAKVVDAWESGATVALLFVRDGGIDDRLVRNTTESLSGLAGVTAFVIPSSEIARYSAITAGVGVERVPALVVMTPKGAAANGPTASVLYGFQDRQAVVQAIVDAGYEGPTLAYHP
jgi:hypothetical protein